MATQGTIAFTSAINTAPFLNGLAQIRSGINTLPRTTNAAMSSINSQFATGFGSIGKLIGSYLAFSQLKDLGKEIINVRSEMQSLMIAFQTMLKSKSAADKMMKQVVQFAAQTPFNVTEVGAATKSLLAYGFAASDVFKTLRRLSDVSSGLKIPLNDLIYLYGTLRVQNRAYARDITQFAQRGIPIYDELAKVLGTTTDGVKEMVSAGKVGFKQVEEAFINMTSAGGTFYDLTAKNSQTLSGLISNLGDKFTAMFNEIGESQEGLIIGGIKGIGNLVDNYEDVLKVLVAIIAAYGSYKAALFLINNANTISTIVRSTQAYVSLALSIRSAADAQAFFSLSAAAMTPAGWALLAAAIIGVVVALALYSDKLFDTRDAVQQLKDENEKYQATLNAQKQKTSELLSVINDEAATRRQQIAAFNQLAKMYPQALRNLDLDAFKRKGVTEAQKEMNAAFDRVSFNTLNARLKEAELQLTSFEAAAKRSKDVAAISPDAAEQANIYAKSIQDAKIKVGELKKQIEEFKKEEFQALPFDKQLKYYEDLENSLKNRKEQLLQAIRNEEKMVQVGESLSVIFMQFSLKSLNAQLLEAHNSLEALKKTADNSKDNTQNYKYWQDEFEKNQGLLRDLPKAAKGSKLWNQYAKAIKDAQKNLDAYNVTAKAKKEDEVFAPGSLKAIDQAAQKAQEALEKTNGKNIEAIQKYNQIRFDNEQKAAEIRKSLEIRTFEQEIEYKKKEYQKYQSLVLNISQDAADKNYSDLKASGDNYIAYLESQIDLLGGKIDSGTSTVQDRTNFFIATNALEEETQSFDKYKQRIDDAKDSVATLTDYLNLLRLEQEKLNQADVQRTTFLANKIVEVEAERNRLLRDFATQTNLGGAGIANIKKYYDSLRKTITDNAKKQMNPFNSLGISVGVAEQLKQVTKAEGEAITELSVETVKKTSQAYKELNRIILGDQKKVLRERIQQLQRYKEDLSRKGVTDGDEFNRVSDDILGLQFELEQANFQAYNDLLGIVQNIGGAFEGIEGTLGQIGGAISGLASGASTVVSVLQGISSGNPVQVIGAVVNGVVKVFETIAKNRQANKEFEKERQLAINAQKQQYYEMQREERRLSSIQKGNPFVKNYAGILKDGSNALKESTKDYQASLKKLQNGIAKGSTKDYLDTKDLFGSLILGPVGLLATALFGKKTTDSYLPLLKLYPNLVKTLKDGKQEFDVALAQSLIDNDRVDEATKQLLEDAISNVEAMEDAKQQMLDVIIDLTGQIGDQLRDNLVNAFKEGSSAAEAFGKTVGQVIEDIVAKSLFSAIFGDALDKLTADLVKSGDVANGGDGRLDDDLVRFFQTYPQLAEMYYKSLADAKEMASKYGIDILGAGTGTGNSLSGAIKGITEQTAGIIAGQMNAIRIYAAQGIEINRGQLRELVLISKNVAVYLPYLQGIDYKLSQLATRDSLRPIG